MPYVGVIRRPLPQLPCFLLLAFLYVLDMIFVLISRMTSVGLGMTFALIDEPRRVGYMMKCFALLGATTPTAPLIRPL